jgi:NAD(P)H-flavin reductase
MRPTSVRVRAVRRDTYDTFTLALEPPPGGAGFQPGQFNMLYVFGVGEVPISMSSDPAEPGIVLHTIRAVGSVPPALARVRPGDSVGVRGPFGSSWPMAAARGHDVVLVSGGIGLAPLRPAIYHLLRHRGDYGRLVLLHGARTPDDMLYQDELDTWQARPDFQVLLTVDRAKAGWRGPIGTVTMLFPQAVFDARQAVALMCGPEVMMRFALYEFEKRQVAPDRLYLSLERNMQCALGMCGHCQFGPSFVCLDGPVLRYDRIRRFWEVREA